MRGRQRWARQAGARARKLALAAWMGLAVPAGTHGLAAQGTPASIEGFGVSYRAPAGWTLSGGDGRMQAWTNASQTAALVVYAGHFAPLQLALGDAQRVLGVPRDEDTKVITPLSATTFGGHAGMAGSLRVSGDRSVVAHVAVVQLDDSTAIGAVAVLEASAPVSALEAVAKEVAGVLSAATVRAAAGDASLRDRLIGAWEVHKVYTSGPTGGGYTNEESWRFSADGTYTYRKRFSVSMPGAAVTPEEKDESGRWYAAGGALVLLTPEGRITADVQLNGDQLVLDGTTFSKR